MTDEDILQCFQLSLHYIHFHPAQVRSLLLVAALWYDPTAQTDITSPQCSGLKKKKKEKENLLSALCDGVQLPSLFHQKLHKTTHTASNTTCPWSQFKKKKRFQGSFAGRAHRQHYLISIELFQMKCKRCESRCRLVSSPGAACRLAFMIHTFPERKLLLQAVWTATALRLLPHEETVKKGSLAALSGSCGRTGRRLLCSETLLLM